MFFSHSHRYVYWKSYSGFHRIEHNVLQLVSNTYVFVSHSIFLQLRTQTRVSHLEENIICKTSKVLITENTVLGMIVEVNVQKKNWIQDSKRIRSMACLMMSYQLAWPFIGWYYVGYAVTPSRLKQQHCSISIHYLCQCCLQLEKYIHLRMSSRKCKPMSQCVKQ